MKNIHILPTDKPSRLIIYSTLLNEFRLLDEPIEDWNHKKNIYITNDEEIKIGDYYLSLGVAFKCTALPLSDTLAEKIILTTDQDLINDGVQSIDDKFLEWFVKNPSCEEVDVKNPLIANISDFGYKIIIPKEVDVLELGQIIPKEETKQETLEEVAKKMLSDNKHKKATFETMIEFAKWQKEQDKNKFSEEEVELIANEMVNWAIDNIGNPFPQSGKKFDEVIAKFKNK